MFFDFEAIYNETKGEQFASGKRRFYDNRVKELVTAKIDGKYIVKAKVGGVTGEHAPSITFDETGGLYDYACDCGHNVLIDGPCRHIIATALSYEERNPTEIVSGVESKGSDPLALTLLREYNKRRHGRRVQHSDGIEIIPVLDIYDSGFSLRFKLSGGDKQYNLRDIGDFVRAMKTGSYKRYGVYLELLHIRENFTENSRKLVDFIEACVSERGIPQKFCDVLPLSSGDIDAFFEIVEGMLLNTGKTGFIKIEPFNTRFPVCVNVAEEDGGYVLHISLEGFRFYSGKKYDYVHHRHSIYRLDKAYLAATSLFFNAFESKNRLFVSKSDMGAFYNGVLVSILEYIGISAENIDLAAYEAAPLRCAVYLTGAEDAGLSARVETAYEDVKFDLFTGNVPTDVVRDFDSENELRGIFSKYFPDWPGLNLKRDDEIFSFLKFGISELMGYADVYMADDMRRLKLKGAPRIGVGVRVKRGYTLGLELTAEEYTAEELNAILSAYRLQKKYVRLSTGFVSLDDETIGALSDILDLAENKDDGYEMPLRYAPYLNAELSKGMFSLARDSAFKELINRLTTAVDADIAVPESLAPIMRNYQKSGYRWMKTLCAFDFGGILADDMGLGKTLQVIALILSEPNKKTLIVCPTTLMLNWVHEIKKFAPTLTYAVVSGTQDARRKTIENCANYDIVITSYDLMRRDVEYYLEETFDYVIADEAQYIKNPETQNALSMKRLNAVRRLALTGTPIENSLSELWSIFDFIMPQYLGSYPAFRDRFEAPAAAGDAAASERLRRYVAPFILRRLKVDVLKELPPKMESVVRAQNEGEQRRLYDANLSTVKSSVSEGTEVNRVVFLSLLTRLREIACDPSLVYADYVGNSAKLDTALELIQTAVSGGHKILLFSQFTQMLEIIRKRLVDMGISHYVLKGDTPKNERQRLITQFNEDATSVFLISLRAGGTGINLTGADIVIHYDPWWNESVMNQATDRAYRIGQNKSVQVYKLIMADSIEEQILALQEHKKQLSGTVVGRNNDIKDIIEAFKTQFSVS